MLKVLRTIEPADKILQHRETGLGSGFPVILTVVKCIKDYCSSTIFKEIFQQCTDLLEEDEDVEAEQLTHSGRSGSKRKIKPNE